MYRKYLYTAESVINLYLHKKEINVCQEHTYVGTEIDGSSDNNIGINYIFTQKSKERETFNSMWLNTKRTSDKQHI
jgi:hypothetical protein